MCFYVVIEQQRSSLGDVHFLTCPVRPEDPDPTWLSITTSPCGYSHNTLLLKTLNIQGVNAPPRYIGLCVRPIGAKDLNSGDLAKKLPVWLEYLRHLGVDHVFLYLPEVSDNVRKVVDFYQRETLRLLTTVEWDVMNKNLDPLVSQEAGIMDCLYRNMVGYKYIMVQSFMEVPIFGDRNGNMKQLAKSDWFQEKMDKYGGLRLEHGSSSEAELKLIPPAFIVESKLILATAANHFISLTRRPYHQILDRRDVRTGNMNEINTNLLQGLQKLADAKLTRK